MTKPLPVVGAERDTWGDRLNEYLTEQEALKASLVSPAFTGTPTGITKTHVGLGSVDDTADMDKPVSTAQGVALGLKVATADADAVMAAKVVDAASLTRGALNATYLRVDGDHLPGGEATMSRLAVMSTSIATSSGVLRLSYFTAQKTETINSLRIVSGNTAAGASPSLVRAGIWSIAEDGALVLVASIPSDTTLLATAATVYTRALSAPLYKVAGQRYAYGLLVVTAATAPTVSGVITALTGATATEMGESLRLSGYATGQTDLPAALAGVGMPNTPQFMYAVLVP